jgi:hypothetical protein
METATLPFFPQHKSLLTIRRDRRRLRGTGSLQGTMANAERYYPARSGSVNVSATGSANAKLGDSWYSIAAFNSRVSVEGRYGNATVSY